MKCNEITREQLAALHTADDELRDHVATCATCHHRLQNVSAVVDALQSEEAVAPRMPLPSELDNKVMAGIDSMLADKIAQQTIPKVVSSQTGTVAPSRLRLAVAIAAIVIMVLLPILIFMILLQKEDSHDRDQADRFVNQDHEATVKEDVGILPDSESGITSIFDEDDIPIRLQEEFRVRSHPRRILFDDVVAVNLETGEKWRPLFQEENASDIADLLSPDEEGGWKILPLDVDPDVAGADSLQPDNATVESAPVDVANHSDPFSDPNFGDVNRDGYRSLADAEQLCANLADPDVSNNDEYDFNRDGTVDVMDALLLAKVAAAQ